MVKKDKRLQKMRQNPKTVTYDILVLVLQTHGFIISEGKGSHVTIRAEIGDRVWRDTVAKPHGHSKFVNQAAVKKALKMIDEINALQAETDEESDDDDETE